MQIMQDAQAAVQANTRELEGMPFEHVLHEYLVFLRLKVFHALYYSVIMLCFSKTFRREHPWLAQRDRASMSSGRNPESLLSTIMALCRAASKVHDMKTPSDRQRASLYHCPPRAVEDIWRSHLNTVSIHLFLERMEQAHAQRASRRSCRMPRLLTCLHGTLVGPGGLHGSVRCDRGHLSALCVSSFPGGKDHPTGGQFHHKLQNNRIIA